MLKTKTAVFPDQRKTAAQTEREIDTPNYTSQCSHSCRCAPSDLELVRDWCQGEGLKFRYRIGCPGKRIPSGWFTAKGESVSCAFVEKNIYQFLKAQIDAGKNICVTPSKIRAIRMMARFEALPADTHQKEGATHV